MPRNGLDIKKQDAENEDGDDADTKEGEGEEDEDGDAPMIESEYDSVEQSAHYSNAQNQQSAVPSNVTDFGHAPVAPPQVLLNSIKDENVRNLMMSWYWAGYYTGLHEGQQNSNSK